MQDQRNEWKQQYDALLKGKIEKLKAMSPEAREQLRGRFGELCKEIRWFPPIGPISSRPPTLSLH
jgi:hypothetical protein